LLFGMLVSGITELTKDDVIEDSQATWLAIDGIASCCRQGWRASSVSYATRTGHDGQHRPTCAGC
jgi:hypothetical protein